MTAEKYARPLALGVALLANADDLLDDAELLLDAGRPARALVLCVCAAEEMAKIFFCVDALTTGAAIPASNSREWRDHKEKILSTLALDVAFVHPSPELAVKQLKSEAEALFQARMASLYVDHDAEEIRMPSGGGFDTASLLERLRANSRNLHTFFDRATPELFAEVAPHLPELAAAFEPYLDENDLPGTLQVLRSVVATTFSGLEGTSSTP